MNAPNRDNKVPQMIGSRGSHSWILRTLEQLPRGKALDAPTGRGAIAKAMKELGYEVYCADIDPGLYAGEFPFERVDLNGPLPYQDAFFDVVVCANALHRIANFRFALKEFGRVLKPGGTLLISVNNYASIAKRLKFFMVGSLSETNNELTHWQTIDDANANFRQALFFPAIQNGLEKAGLTTIEVRAQSRRLNHYFLFPFAVLAYLASFLQSPKSRRRNWVQITRGSAVNFGGKSLFIRADKPA